MSAFSRQWPHLAVLILLVGTMACDDPTEGPLTGAQHIRILAPAADEVVYGDEVVFAVAVTEPGVALAEPGRVPNETVAPAGDLHVTPRFLLNDRDISSHFLSGPRNVKMGGGVIHVAWLPLADLATTGESLFQVQTGDETVTVRFQVGTPELILDYEVVEERDGSFTPVPARLTVVGLEETDTPVLAQSSMAAVDPPGRETRRRFVETDTGGGRIGLPAGSYAVIASRGLRHSLAVHHMAGDGSFKLRFVLRPLTVQPDHLTCDFHVHGLASADSALPPAPRLRSFRAGGVDLLVAADHNVVTDYAPFLGGKNDLLTVVGVEAGLQTVTANGTESLGHWTAWPLQGRAATGKPTANGLIVSRVPALQDRQAYEVYQQLAPFMDPAVAGLLEAAGQPALPVIQLNHPRGLQSPSTRRVQRERSYLQAMDFQPDRPLPTTPNNEPNSFLVRLAPDGEMGNSSFDAIELYNRASLSLYLETRADYFALLRAGLVATATGNTDSHSIGEMPGGVPVNVVRLAANRDAWNPADATGTKQLLAALVQAVRGGQVVGTTGPLLELSVQADGVEVFPGQMITGSTVMTRLTVRAPAWVPVEEVRWYVDGRLHAAVPVSRPVRRQDSATLDAGEQTDIRVWQLERSFTWKEDGFLMVEAGERLPRDPDQPPPEVGLYGRAVPHHWSLAFTNPVRVDADGDGRWQPGGGN